MRGEMDRPPPPVGVVTATEQEYHQIRDVLTELLPAVRRLLAGGSSDVEVLADLWLTLQHNPRQTADLLGAAAILHLAQRTAQPLTALAPRTTRIPTDADQRGTSTAEPCS